MSEKTFMHDDDLPSLPLPRLEDTIERYISSCEGVGASPESLTETRRRWKEAQESGVLDGLQRALEERAASSRNWLEEWWNTVAYLMGRDSIAINSNFGGPATYTFWPKEISTQLHRAAALAHHTLLFYKAIVDEKLPPQKMGGQPLCMNQYRHIFTECRVPGVTCDTQTSAFDSQPRHMVVLHRGRFFRVDSFDSDFYPLPISMIHEQLERVVALGNTLDSNGIAPENIGVLSADNRTDWAKCRESLISADPVNASHFATIQSAIYILVLDQSTPKDAQDNLRECIYGNAQDRFFDKMYSLIVFANGESGLNGEHSPADAMVCVHCTNFARESMMECLAQGNVSLCTHPSPFAASLVHSRSHTASDSVSHLHFQRVPQSVALRIPIVLEQYSARRDKLDLLFYVYTGFGKEFPKQFKIHPDFLMQMALQLTYYRTHKQPCATYETGTARLFFHGRTETVRACTSETREWTRAMGDPTVSSHDCLRLLQRAIKQHFTLMKRATLGSGFDRHLLGLSIVASMQGKADLPIFTDPNYTLSGGAGHFVLSTSTIGFSSAVGGFAPMLENGYGTCYSIQEDTISCVISAWKGSDTSALLFRNALKQSLDDIRDLLVSESKSKL